MVALREGMRGVNTHPFPKAILATVKLYLRSETVHNFLFPKTENLELLPPHYFLPSSATEVNTHLVTPISLQR